jgi:hypothetical protein
MSSNSDSTIYSLFQLNILCVGSRILNGSLNSHVKESVKVLIK